MIRFCDLRPAGIVGGRFAFYDTVTDKFVQSDLGPAWDTWKECDESMFASAYFKERLRGLCPAWVFEPIPKQDDDELMWVDYQYEVVRRSL